MTLENRKQAARNWFESLQRQIIARFEEIEETAAPDGGPDAPAGYFTLTPWKRGNGNADEGGGLTGMLHGRVFEKAGVHVSTVYGDLPRDLRGTMPGTDTGTQFWASGISVIAHPRNPHVPAAHMNTRMIITEKQWFGGGGDLNPMLDAYRDPLHEDTVIFHGAMKKVCDSYDPEYFPKFRKWCDDYFFLPHRNEPRGTGGIFYDRHHSGNWDRDFAFTQDVGRAFLETYARIVMTRAGHTWTHEDRQEQLARRGRYAEYNLMYDRGTLFGLKTGGNIDAILSSLPPLARWP